MSRRRRDADAAHTSGPRGLVRVTLPLLRLVQRVRVLIADDEPLLRLLLRAQLELRGSHVVAEVASRAEVVDATSALCPDVAVLDYNLADGAVVDVLAGVRGTCPAAFVVVLSADAAELRRREVMAAGAHAYYEKTPDMVRRFPAWLAEQWRVHSGEAA